MKSQQESNGKGQAETSTEKKRLQGPLLTLAGLCIFLGANFVYDAWSHAGSSSNNNSSSSSSSSSSSNSGSSNSNSNTRTAFNSKPLETCWTTTDTPVYSHVEGFCSSFPADKTASYLWNANIDSILEMTFMDDKSIDSSADKEWMHDVLRSILRPIRLRDGLRSLPSSSASASASPMTNPWGRVIERLHEKLQHPATAPVVSIVVFGGSTVQGVGSCVLPSFMTEQSKQSSSSSSALDCAWPVRLQNVLDRIVGQGVVQVTVVAIPTATTELFTAMVQDGRVLQQTQQTDGKGDAASQIQTADLILHAAASQDNFQQDRDHATMENVKYQEHQLFVQQDFIRASLQSQPCHAQQTPAVVYLDDYLSGQGHETMVADSITARVIHQLTDYYTAAGLVSYASVVNRLVMADTDQSVFGGGGATGTTGSLNYGKVAHVGVLWTLVFAALEFTVDYCSHVSANSETHDSSSQTPLISEDLIRRVRTVPPPYLNGNSSLVTVSKEWRQEEKKMLDRRHAVCGGDGHKNVTVLPPSCVLAVTSNSGAGPKKVSSLQDYFKPANYKESIGWKLLETGTLRATKAQASLKLEITVPENQSISHVQVFVVREDSDANTESAAALLQIKLILPGNEEKSVEVEASHNSAARVALPVRVEVQPPAAAGTSVQLELLLIKGETVDIEGLFVC